MREFPSGKTLAILRLATHTFYPAKEGEPVKQTQWHTAKMWGTERIEKLRNYIIKGSHVLISGELEYETYLDKDGRSRSTTHVRVRYLVDLDR